MAKFNLQTAQGNFSSGLSAYTEKQYLLPEVDILEDEAEIYYIYELPGIDTATLNVELSSDQIFVTANSRQRDKKLVHQERKRGNFFRQLPLPDNVDRDSAQADFNQGILEISFTKENTF